MSQPHSDPAGVQGWTPSPLGRGSIDILFACLATVALTSWSAVCLNVPAPTDNRRKKIFRKAWVAWVGILGPEYLFLIALGQWHSARRSIKAFRMLGYRNWTTRHGFFADMGGFAMMTSDGIRIPLCTKSLRWLLCEKFLSDEQFREEVLVHHAITDDRTQSDILVKFLAFLQSLWFCINCVARIARDLPLTTLELIVLSFFIPTAGIYLLWRSKPCDIESSHTLRLAVSLDEIRDRAGLLQRPWHENPFDFLEGEKWHVSALHQYWLNLFRYILHPTRWFARSVRHPNVVRQRRSDSELMFMPLRIAILEPIVGIPFLAANFAAWDWFFPTPSERFFWRLCAVLLIAVYCLSPLMHTLFEFIWTPEHERQRLQQYRKDLQRPHFDDIPLDESETIIANTDGGGGGGGGNNGGSYAKYQIVAARLRNNSPTDNPEMDVPLRLLLAGTAIAATYAVCRGYLIVEALLAFRRMPHATFEAVQWTQYFPHIGG